MLEYLGLLILFAFGVGLVLYIMRLRRMETANVLLQNKNRQARQFYDEMQERVDGIRKYRHDLQRHIRIVEQFLEEGKQFEDYQEYRDLQGFIQRIQDDIADMRVKRYSEDELINAICEIKVEECNERGIPLDLEVHVSEGTMDGIDSYYLTGILMNLLDNAMEAQLRLRQRPDRTDDPVRGMSFRMTEEKGGLAICVGNDVEQDFVPDFRTTKPDKEEHGMGLSIARDYAGRYGGQLAIDYDKDRHYLTIGTLLYPAYQDGRRA